jgi:hypothetical protein
MNRYQPSKLVPIINSFEGLEELDDVNTNIKMEKTVKPLPIFVARVGIFLNCSQLLIEIAIGKYEIKIINNEQISIQKLHHIYQHSERVQKQEHHTFHTYKPKQKRSFTVILKYIHATANMNDTKKEIEDLGYTVTNIWNIKKQSTK